MRTPCPARKSATVNAASHASCPAGVPAPGRDASQAAPAGSGRPASRWSMIHFIGQGRSTSSPTPASISPTTAASPPDWGRT